MKIKISLSTGRTAGLQHQELHIRLEQRDQPGRPPGLLQAGPDAQLAEAQPQQREGEREESHGDRGEGVQDPAGPGAGALRLPSPGRVVRDDLPLLLHEGGGQPRLLLLPQLGEEPDTQLQDKQLQSKN